MATFVFTPPAFMGGGAFFPKTGTTRLKARTLRFILMCGISQRQHALNHLLLGISDAAISFEEPRDSVLSSKYMGEKELRVLSCPAGHQSVDAMTIRELLGGRLAVPINLSPCLNAINQCPEAQLVNFRFRDVEYGNRAQAEFLQAGGLILSFSGSSLASDGSEVSECSIEASHDVALPIYFCYRQNAWTDRHQTVFLHLLRHLAS